MKKHIIYILFALTGGLSAFTSCSKDGDEIVRTLEAEKQDYILDYKAQSLEIGVTSSDTYQAEWVGEAWGSVSLNDNGIVVTVNENGGTAARYATVKLYHSNELRTMAIDVMQNGNNPVLNVIPDNINFALIGGEYVFEVETDIESWEATTDATWITIESYVKSNEFVVRADKNDVMETKTAKLTVSAGAGDQKVSKEVEVTIDPLTKYLLPYYQFNDSDLIAEARAYLEGPDLYCEYMGGASMINTFHWFRTQSPIFSTIRYEVIIGRGASISATLIMDSEYASYYNAVDDMTELLLEDGFEYLFTNNNGVYFWKELSDTAMYQCLARITFTGNVIFTAEMTKPVAYSDPTFDVVPLPALSWGVNRTTVESWEASNGGTLDTDNGTGMLTYTVPVSTEFYMRWYTFGNYSTSAYDDLVQISVLYEESELNKFFTTVTSYGTILNTNLYDLLLNSGFELLGYDSNGVPAFYSASRDIALAVVGYATSDNPTVIKYSSFMYFQYDASSSSPGVAKSAHAYADYGIKGLTVVPVKIVENVAN